MKSVLVIGLGRFGRHICSKLDELGHQVMAIDNQEDRVQAVMDYVANAQIGDSTDEEFMKSIGVRDFDLCIVAIGDHFQTSLETTFVLKELGAKKIVARASRDRYAKLLLWNGADEIVYPERQLANWTAIRYSGDHILDYIDLDGDNDIFEIEVPQEWVNKSVQQLRIRQKYGINVLAVRENGIMQAQIGPDTVFMPGTSVLVFGRLKDLEKHFSD